MPLTCYRETINEKYKDKLQKSYEAPMYTIFSHVFTGLANKKITRPAKDFESHNNQKAVKCSVKASEGFLYCLERAFMFIPKPTQFIPYETISVIVMSRVGGAVSASRTFDITVEIRGGVNYQFSNINREEQGCLQAFFELKGIKLRNEMVDDGPSILERALNAEDATSDEEMVGARADRGSADEDEESPDEDFRASSESDVEEEFDEHYESSGSDEEEGGARSDPEERPKKKTKTGTAGK